MKSVFIILLFIALGSCKNEDAIIGDRYFRSGEYEKAIDSYTDYLALKPDNIKSLYNRGRAYEELGKYQEAVKNFNKVLELDPNHMQAHLSIAAEFYRQKLYQDAIYQCDLVLKNNQSSHAYLLRARGKQKSGKIREAMADYNAAISLDSNMGEAYFYRGTLKIYSKMKTSACADFKIAESLNMQAATTARKEYCN
jgi:tetratricopeptide (TPR) repeat protein